MFLTKRLQLFTTTDHSPYRVLALTIANMLILVGMKVGLYASCVLGISS